MNALYFVVVVVSISTMTTVNTNAELKSDTVAKCFSGTLPESSVSVISALFN